MHWVQKSFVYLKMTTVENHQKIIIITAPSGAGKTSITTYLLEQLPNLAFSISAATRSPRGTEKNGVEYYFMSVEEFQEKIRKEDFLEWEMVYEGKYYGTLKSEISRIWAQGKTPILDIDVKGAIHVQQMYPGKTLSIFIEPPSVEELERRLASRGTETKESLAARVNKASYEISFKHHFNHTVVNDDLTQARTKTLSIINSFLDS